MGYQRRVHGESIIKVVLVASQTLIIDTSSTMKYILMLKICSIFALHLEEAPINRDLTDMTEEEFLDFFELPDIDDQEEKERRREVLKQHQDEVKEIHEKFANGEIDWDAGIYVFSDLPDEDFVTSHTGLLGNFTYDPESDRFCGDEATLKKPVDQNGAVIVAVEANWAFSVYKAGIFAGCTGVSDPDHAVTV